MSSAILAPIHAELRRILLTTPGLPALIAWEGRTVEPVVGQPWADEQLGLVASTPVSFGWAGETEERLLYTVGLRWPRNESSPSFAGKDLADAIRARFWSGREVVTPDGRMRGAVLSATVATAIPSPGWLHYPLSVTLYARRATLMGLSA